MASKAPPLLRLLLHRPLHRTANPPSLRLTTQIFPPSSPPPSATQISPPSSPPPSATQVRPAHSIPRPPKPPRTVRLPPGADPASDEHGSSSSSGDRPAPNPAYYQLSFTCIPCGHRSHHNVSKQAYHRGSTLITCPGCRNRHVISDHLNIFGDRKITVEDLMRERGRLVKRGRLGEDGDVEFWPEEGDAGEGEVGSRG